MDVKKKIGTFCKDFVKLFLLFAVIFAVIDLPILYAASGWEVIEEDEVFTLTGTLDGSASIWDVRGAYDKLCFKIDGTEYLLPWVGSDEELEEFCSFLSDYKEPVTLTAVKKQGFVQRVFYKQRQILAISTASKSVDMTEPYNNRCESETKGFRVLISILLMLEIAAVVVFYVFANRPRPKKSTEKKKNKKQTKFR